MVASVGQTKLLFEILSCPIFGLWKFSIVKSFFNISWDAHDFHGCGMAKNTLKLNDMKMK
jgi:hypothetical protein